MGRRKRFIDKKNSATFQLLARDSAVPTPSGAGADRVFVRVDNNPYASHGLLDEDESENPQNSDYVDDDSGSIFADAPGDVDSDEDGGNRAAARLKPTPSPSSSGLPDHVRREILELGLPDDGYNYLFHLREIRNAGGGASFYENSKAKLDQVPMDVKAYDASRVRVDSRVKENPRENAIYGVSERTIGVRVQKAVDPDIAALLDDADSRFGSDVDELEEDFVMQANLPDVSLVSEKRAVDEAIVDSSGEEEERGECSSQICEDQLRRDECATEKPRVRRLLDEQFDLLTLREYDSDHEYDDDDHGDDDGYLEKEDEPLAGKLNDVLKGYLKDELELSDKYKAPSEFLNDDEKSSKVEDVDSPTYVIQKCREYAEMYSQETEDVVVLEESSDESEEWDCETIVSTYSNLDNHPGRIGAPHMRKKRVTTLYGVSADSNNVISLRGREKLPSEYLPHARRSVTEKVKKSTSSEAEQRRRKTHGAETREEKKERKAAVKGEQREARKAKKSLKELYRCEAQRAQKVAATTGPCSVHLM